MSTPTFTLMLTIFVLGLFVGSNLGVILMCLLHVAGRNTFADSRMASVAVQIND